MRSMSTSKLAVMFISMSLSLPWNGSLALCSSQEAKHVDHCLNQMQQRNLPRRGHYFPAAANSESKSYCSCQFPFPGKCRDGVPSGIDV